MSYRCFNVALCGLGRAGKIHVGNLHSNPHTRIKYIVEADINMASTYIEQHYGPALAHVKLINKSEFFDLALSDPELDAVIVCTPTPTHEEFICASLKAGKSVFSEKPIAENLSEIEACYNTAKLNKVILFCSFNRRFDPSVKQVRDRIKSKEVGKIHMMKTCSRDSPIPSIEYIKQSGGFFHDCAVHDIDAVTWCLEEYPCRVYTMARCHNSEYTQLNDVDTAVINLEFPSGVLAVINLSRHSNFGYDQRLEVHGDQGMIISENQRPTNLQIFNSNGIHLDSLKYSFPQRYADSYKIALDTFLDVIEGKMELNITFNSVINVSMIADACEKSLKLKQAIEFVPKI